MKRIIAVLVLVLAINALADICEWKDPKTGIVWSCNIANGKVSLGGVDTRWRSYPTLNAVPTETVGEIIIPSTFYGYPLTKIDKSAFCFCEKLTSVTIPEGVTSVGNSAFYDCSKLASIVIPSSVTSIGRCAFQGCKGLAFVTIPSSVTSIGSDAFAGCSGLTFMSIPEGVKNIGETAFYGCKGVTFVAIPSSVTSIGSGSFLGCTGLISVYISDLAAWCNIKFEGLNANPFYCAHKLYLNGTEITDLVIPEGVTSIGNYAFAGCSGLTSITIPSSVTSIGNGAFQNCSGLTYVKIPKSVKTIGEDAFKGCDKLFATMREDAFNKYGRFGGNFAPGIKPNKGDVIRIGAVGLYDLKITRFLSAREVGFEDAKNDSLAVVVKTEGNKLFVFKVIDEMHEYVDGDHLGAGFYRYVGVKDVGRSRIRAFEEIYIPDEYQGFYK